MNKIIKGEFESNLNNIFLKESPNSILIVTGKKSFKDSDAEIFFNKISSKYNITLYSKTDKNPSFNEILRLLKKHEHSNFDLIVAYGGGSVIDFSKLVALFKNNTSLFKNNFQNSADLINTIPIIAIPTTAGSGAESTKFAVIYREKTKFSILNKRILPKYAILDPKTTFSLSKYKIACSTIDAVCQSIESLWAKNKNRESELYALKSLTLIYTNISRIYENNENIRSLLLEGSNLSGKAINISRTTAPHAMSYYLTTFHNIPHGEAVAINIEPFIKMNFDSIREENKVKLLEIFKVTTKNEFITSIKLLKLKLGLKLDLSSIRNLNINTYSSFINIERLKNNPVELTTNDILNLIKKSSLKRKLN
ncbi:MAG: iron-containing alcohol dehydrogenase [Flavobacteriaceae bacterium]